MKTLFYQVRWSRGIENTVKAICDEIDCDCVVYPVTGAPASVKEIWFCVKEKDVGFVEKQMNL